MAKEKPEKDREKEKEENEKESPKPRRKKFLFIIIGVLVLLIVTGGGAYVAARIGLGGDLLGGIFGVNGGGETAQLKEPEYMFEVPEIVVNLGNDERRRFLSVKFYVGHDHPGLDEELERRMPEIRDAVLGILWEKTAGDIAADNSKERLREELFEVVNGMLRTGEIRGIYFWHVMIQ